MSFNSWPKVAAGSFDSGLTLGTSTTSYYEGGFPAEEFREKTYIAFKSEGATTDFAYLRQIGTSDRMHISLDFHDGTEDGHFSIAKVNSADPNASRTELFTINNDGAEFTVPVKPTAWQSGDIMTSLVTEISQGKLYKNDVLDSLTFIKTTTIDKRDNNGVITMLEAQVDFTLKSSTDRCAVHLHAPYELEEFGNDELRLEIYDTVDGSQDTTEVFSSKHVWRNATGGGTRSTTIFPTLFKYTPVVAPSNLNRRLLVKIYNDTDDNVFMQQDLQVHITQIKN